MELTVGYGRKLRPDSHNYDYEHEEASVYFKAQVSDEADAVQEIADKARTLFATAKIRVLTELGLEFVSDENGVVRETERIAADVVSQLPGSTIITQTIPAAPIAALAAPAPVAVGAVPVAPPAVAPTVVIAPPAVGAMPVAPGGGKAAINGSVTLASGQQLSQAEAVAFYMQAPNDWYDNRGPTKNEYAPDFRHKTVTLAPNKNGKSYNLGLNAADFVAQGYQI